MNLTLFPCTEQGITLRDYQVDAVNDGLRYFQDPNAKYGALMVLPTGSGKSLVIAGIATKLDEPTLVFTRFIEESQQLVDALGDQAEIVTGETPKRERERIIEDFRSGKIRVVSNVGVLTVGFDFPELETIVMARPTMSLALYYQMIGRGIRVHPDKSLTWVVDLCDNHRKFGAVEDLHLTRTTPVKWVITSRGRQLTNVYYGERRL